MNHYKTRNKFEIRDLTLLFFAAMVTLLFTFYGQAQTTTENMPGLGDDAVDYLKQNNSSESLENAAAAGAFVEQAKLTAADGASLDNLGFSVAVSGDTAIVGAPRNSGGTGLQNRGAAYVYVRNNGVWTPQQKLIPSDGASNDQFGYSVAINGDTVAVGRNNSTTGQNRSDGKVYIFTRTGASWTETQTLVSSDIAQGDSFGYSLAFEGDTLAVGARNKNIGGTFFRGAAYIFTRPSAGGSFTQQARVLASDGGPNDFFGEAVSLSGETLIVGSVNDFGQPNAAGKAYVFVRSGSTWTEQQILQATGGAPNGAFGVSVSVSGDYAVIGANTEPIGTSGELGAAYVFERNGTVWTERQKLTAQEATPRNDRFGYAVAIKGDTIAVGSPFHEYVASIANHGAVYVYQRSGATWSRTQKLLHNDPAPDNLGQALAFDGNSILAGAPAKNSARGAAYVFNAVGNAQAKLLGDPLGSTQYGQAVAVSGDTAAVGSFNGVYIFVRSGENWEFRQKIASTVNGTTTLAPGSSIAISGETMVIGAGGSRINGNTGQGAVLVYTRNGSQWVFQQQLTASDGGVNDLFGTKIAFSEDTIVAGAHGDAVAGNTQRGAAYVFTRTGTTWTEQQKLTAADGIANDQFGLSVAVSGNTVVVGAEFADFGGASDRGAAYVFTRSGATWTQQAKLTASDGGSFKRFGGSVAVENDTAIVGSVQAGAANDNQGAAYVYTRTGAAWTERQKLSARDGKTFDFFGASLALSGDRLIVGANAADNRQRRVENTGAVYIFNRQGSVWNGGGKLQAFDGDTGDQLGTSVAISGNLVVSGAVGDDLPGVFSQGSAYVFDLDTDIVRLGFQISDFDGDGRADLSVYRGGTWYVSNSADNQRPVVQFGLASDKITPADFDGDGKTDIAVFRDGTWYIRQSSDNQISVRQFGVAGDVPVPADFDGDGRAEIAVFRPSDGVWYRLNSSDGQFVAIRFGLSGDKPVIGDFDGDGRADLVVFRPSDTVWYRLNSSDGQFSAVQFGLAADKIVAADYDGDGKTDIAVFRDGIWYARQSSDGQLLNLQFGVAGDVPVPADYDGDGKADVAVYRNGVWYIRQSSNSQNAYGYFGQSGDVPVPNAFTR